MSTVLFTRGHLRSGWRFALFGISTVILLVGSNAVLQTMPACASLLATLHTGPVEPVAILLVQGIGVAFVLGVTAIAARLEKRAIGGFGISLRDAFRSRFWQGIACGLVLVTLVIGLMWLLGGVSFEEQTWSPHLALYAASWAAAFILVGIFEEALFRGYALRTLAEGVGFWPAAFLLATLFGAVHLLNSDETIVGALNVVAYAMFASLTLKRTGNLWFAIGVHAAWDYAQTFLYGVPTSGVRGAGSLLHAHLHGPIWLTGGDAGPEGSLIGNLVLVIAFLWFWRWSRAFPALPSSG